MRLTLNQFPSSNDLVEASRLCIGAIIQPLANQSPLEEPIQVVEYPEGPLRCPRCRAYVNPFFKFVESGQRFLCNICGSKSDVPPEYRCNLDANGYRRDRNFRPELCRGSVEFAVGKDYVVRPLQPPCLLFVLDVSYGAVITGVVSAALRSIRTAVQALASNPNIRMGIITYDQTVTFYSIKTTRSEAEMLVMVDMDDVFVPCPPEEILVKPSDQQHRDMLEKVLDLLESIHDKTRAVSDKTETAMGAAVQVATQALEETGGKVLVFQSNLPTIGAGKLQQRDYYSNNNNSKDKLLYEPQGTFYSTLAINCAEKAITVDLYICANSYVDLATISPMSTKTAGQIFLYPGFNSKKDGEALYHDILHNVTRYTGFDAVMTVRCSSGLKVAEYYGNFYHRTPHELDLATIDCDKTFGIRLEHDSKLKEDTEACLQTALLYTTMDGKRRIRVHTISVPITSAMATIYRNSDVDAIVNLSVKQAVVTVSNSTTVEAHTALTQACVETLYNYRKHCATSSNAGQLILPEPLKLLPLNTLGMIKNPLLQPGLHADERSFLFNFVSSMPALVSVSLVCPRLFCLTELAEDACVPDHEGRVNMPQPLTLSSQSISSSGVYLLDTSRFLYLWIGKDARSEVLNEMFESDDKSEERKRAGIQLARSGDPQSLASRTRLLVESLRKNKPFYQNVHIIVSTALGGVDGLAVETLDETTFFSHMIEDSGLRSRTDSSRGDTKPIEQMSYIDFLCYIHKRIQQKMA